MNTATSKPVDVMIVPEKPPAGQVWSLLFTKVGFLFLAAWIVMLVAGAQTPWDPGYWQTLLLILAVRLTLPPNNSYLNFTSWWRKA